MTTSRSYIFYGLNVVRAFSMIALILVFASNIFVMVNNIKAVNHFEANKGSSEDSHDCDYIEGSTVPNQPAGVFWAIVASLLILFQTLVLFLSEIGWPSRFFDRFFPVLGSEFGLGPLGIFQGLIATQILSHHVDDFTLVAAFFLFSIGCLNMLLGLIFRHSAKPKRSIRSWRQESKSILPTHIADRPVPGKHVPGTFSFSDEKAGYQREIAGMGFGRQAEKAAGLRGFVLQRPEESLPRYATPPPRRSGSTRSSTSSFSSSSLKAEDYGQRDRSRSPSPAKVPAFKSSSTAI